MELVFLSVVRLLKVFFMVFVYYLISMAKNKIDVNQDEKYMSMKKAIVFTILGLVSIVLGSNLVVDNAASLAEAVGISEKMVAAKAK